MKLRICICLVLANILARQEIFTYGFSTSTPSYSSFSIRKQSHAKFHNNGPFLSSSGASIRKASTFAWNWMPSFRLQKSRDLITLQAATSSVDVVDTNDKDSNKSIFSKNSLLGEASSASAFIVMDIALRRLFQKAGISFPSSLAGCGILFVLLGLVKALTGSDLVKDGLEPGASLLAKWSAVFFVPSLILLPLAEPLGSILEVAKVTSVIFAGFMFTLLTTACSVSTIKKFTNGSNDGSNDSSNTLAPAPKPTNPFSDNTFNLFATLSAGFACITSLLARTNAYSLLRGPMQSACLFFMTLTTFLLGFRVQAKLQSTAVHPLIQCTALTWVGAKLLSILMGSTFTDILKVYKTGSLSLMTGGAGDIFLFLLGPTVVSFGWQMFNRSKLIKENIKEVSAAILTSSFGGLFGTAAAVRLLGIAKPSLRLALLSRNITSPLAIAIASILNADVSYAVTMVVISGLIGANSGADILTKFKVNDPIARGLSIGAASHGLGTAAFVNEKEAFPFAAVSMALTASISTVLVSIPPIRELLVRIALGA